MKNLTDQEIQATIERNKGRYFWDAEDMLSLVNTYYLRFANGRIPRLNRPEINPRAYDEYIKRQTQCGGCKSDVMLFFQQKFKNNNP